MRYLVFFNNVYRTSLTRVSEGTSLTSGRTGFAIDCLIDEVFGYAGGTERRDEIRPRTLDTVS